MTKLIKYDDYSCYYVIILVCIFSISTKMCNFAAESTATVCRWCH